MTLALFQSKCLDQRQYHILSIINSSTCRLNEKQERYQAMFKKYKLSDIPEEDQFTESDQKRLEQEAAKAQMGSTFFCIKSSTSS